MIYYWKHKTLLRTENYKIAIVILMCIVFSGLEQYFGAQSKVAEPKSTDSFLNTIKQYKRMQYNGKDQCTVSVTYRIDVSITS